MIFVFDTTEFQDQRRIESSVFRLFVVAKTVAKQQVFVPQIVVDEHTRHVRAGLAEAISTVHSKADELAQYTGRSFEFKLPNAEEELKRWQSWFVERLRRWGFSILPYPSTPHSEVLARDFARKKPFDGKGKGYRDALIWESILELARSNSEEIVLVSKNAGDFGKDGALHPDLVADVVANTWPASRIRLAHGIRAAVDAYLQQSLPPVDPALAAAISNGTKTNVDLRRWLRTGLKAANPTLTIGTEEVIGLPKEARLDEVKSVESITVREARQLAQGETFVLFEATLTAGLRWFGSAPFDARTFAQESRDASASLTPGMYALAQFLVALTTLVVIDEPVHVEGALTFGATGDVLASDIWEARVVKPRKNVPSQR